MTSAVAALTACALAFAALAEQRQAHRELKARELVMRARAACDAGERDRCIELLRRAASLSPEGASRGSATLRDPTLHPAHALRAGSAEDGR